MREVLATTQLTRITGNHYTGTINYPPRGTFAASLERIDPEAWQLRLTRDDRLMMDARVEKRSAEGEEMGFILHGFAMLEGYEHQIEVTQRMVLSLLDTVQRAPRRYDVSYANPPMDYSVGRKGKRA